MNWHFRHQWTVDNNSAGEPCRRCVKCGKEVSLKGRPDAMRGADVSERSDHGGKHGLGGM